MVVDEPLRLVHHHPGYLRIRAAAFRDAKEGNPVVAAAQHAVESAPGFRSWSLHPKTGSAVIQYDPAALDVDDLLKHVARSAGFQGIEIATSPKSNRHELVSGFLNAVQGVNHVVSDLTGDRADLREVVPVGLAALSVVSFILNDTRGRLPDWFSTLYRSYRVFMHWHRPEVRTRERVARQEEERHDAGGKPTTH